MRRDIPVPTLESRSFILRPFHCSDALSLQTHLNDERVARKVSHIPFPYTRQHAQEWIKQTECFITQQSTRVDFVIDIGGDVIGSVAFINLEGHKAQVSYWLSPKYWGRGYVTEAVKQLVAFGFDELKLVRIFGYVYTENTASARVLEKAGFVFEGVHTKEWCKMIDGEAQFFDSNYYAIVRDGV